MEVIDALGFVNGAGHSAADARDFFDSIAASAGYESEAAFIRAFKRITGVTPGTWHEGPASSA